MRRRGVLIGGGDKGGVWGRRNEDEEDECRGGAWTRDIRERRDT